MPNTKQPFVYTMKHKMLGDQSTVTTITNNGVTRITVNTNDLHPGSAGSWLLEDNLSSSQRDDRKHVDCGKLRMFV